MEMSRGTAYGLGMSQALATVAVVIFTPMPRTHMYYVQALALNGSVVLSKQQAVTSQSLGLAIPTVLASLLGVLFTNYTYHMREHGLSGIDFNTDAVDQAGVWDLLFWCHCLCAHCIVVAIITSPSNVYGLVSATSFMVYFLYRVCAPKSSGTSMTQENLNILGYFLGVLQCGCQIPGQGQGNAATVLMSVVVLDYFLGVGHTWDRQATIETVTNCRLFYVCCVSFGVAALYSAWLP
jgi:hypothetical protein